MRTRTAGPQGRVANVPSMKTGATTVDSLFGPLPTVETRAMVWLLVNKQLKPVRLRLGTSDGANIEVVNVDGDGGGELPDGAQVVTAVSLATAATQAAGTAGATSNPLMGPQRGGPGRGGPGGGGRGF